MNNSSLSSVGEDERISAISCVEANIKSSKMLVVVIIVSTINQYDLEGIISEGLSFAIHKMDRLRFCLPHSSYQV